MVAAVFLNLHHVDVGLRPAQMVSAEAVVNALGNVVQPPVESVDEQVHVERLHADVAQPLLHAAGPYVAGVLGHGALRGIPVLPRIAEVAAQHQLVELLRLAKDGICQLALTILLLEDQAERMFRVLLGQTAMTAMQTDATVGVHVVLLRPSHQLHADGARPPMTCIVANGRAGEDVDATALLVVLMAEEMVFVSDDAQDGQRVESLRHPLAEGSVGQQLGVHLIVGSGGSPLLGVASPLCRIAFGQRWLAEHRRHEDVAAGGYGRRQLAIGHLHGAQHGGLRQRERTGIELALSSGRASVGGVSDFCCPVVGGDFHRQALLVVKAMSLAEAGLRRSHQRDGQQQRGGFQFRKTGKNQ